VEGDCTTLPFPPATFDGAVASMVLHLVPDWRGALAELVRVLRPGGVVLAARGGSDALWSETSVRFYEALGREPNIVGARTIEEVDEAAAAAGLGVRVLPTVRWPATFVAEDYIAQHEARQFAPLWSVPEEECRRAADETRRWAAGRFGGPVATEATATWHAYDVPGPR
jgi:SAM-dependent methyltransferase